MLRSEFDREILVLALPALGALAAEPLPALADTASSGTSGRRSSQRSRFAATLLTLWLRFRGRRWAVVGA